MIKPTVARCLRVYDILKGDNALRRKLSKPTIAMCRPDHTHVDLPAEVIYVVEQIGALDLDVNSLSKIEIIAYAFKLLIATKPSPEKPTKPMNELKMSDSELTRLSAMSVDEFIAERTRYLEKAIAILNTELDACKLAHAAISRRAEPKATPLNNLNFPEPDEDGEPIKDHASEKPAPKLKQANRKRDLKSYSEFRTWLFTIMFNKRSCWQSNSLEGNPVIHMDDVILEWQAFTEQLLTYKAAHSRLYRLAVQGKFKFENGFIGQIIPYINL